MRCCLTFAAPRTITLPAPNPSFSLLLNRSATVRSWQRTASWGSRG